VFRGSSISRWPDGADSSDNADDFKHRCRTPGLTNSASAASACCQSESDTNIVINEVDYTQSGGDSAEFIELHNRGFAAITSTIDNYRLRIIDSANATIFTVTLSGPGFPLSIPVHGYYTLCAQGSGVCRGNGARAAGTPNATNGFIPSATNWIPNPGDGATPSTPFS
jgi:hypothetical protein